MKRFLTRQEWYDWAAAGKPGMSDEQVRLACRSVTLGAAIEAGLVRRLEGGASEEALESGDKYARKFLADRDREAGVMLLARTTGEDPERARIMAADDVDPELRAMWRDQLARPGPGPAKGSRKAGAMLLDATSQKKLITLALAAGADPEEVRIMARPGADPELRAMWRDQLVDRQSEPSSGSAPLGMDDERYRLHTEAKALAKARCDANPRLDRGETYALAAVEIEEHRNPGVL